MSTKIDDKNEFASYSADEAGTSILGELMAFLKHSKKWWLLPIVVVLALMTLMIALSGSAAAPFIYTLF